jgi:uncharacterized protein
VRIFYATDVHGSDRCFRKFLNAGPHYKADLLILGGDITGKAIVPFRRIADGNYQVRYIGEELVVGEEEAGELAQRVANVGYYPYWCDADEAAELAQNPEKQHALFETLISERVAEWLELAKERLASIAMRCIINAGNDDPLAIDEVFGAQEYVEFAEGRVIQLPNGMELASCGYANETPWQCPRDTPEADLEQRYRRVASHVDRPSQAIFNFHCPPYNTGIDSGPKLDADMRLTSGPGGIEMQPVGSTACRAVITEYEPLIGLHGHLHESKGTYNLGRTLCINPGSEYSEGILRGAIIDVDKGKVKNYILTTG